MNTADQFAPRRAVRHAWWWFLAAAVSIMFLPRSGAAQGPTLIKDTRPGAMSSSPYSLVNVGGTLLFSADDGTTGPELWKSDGTTAGTVLVKDILSGAGGSSPSEIITSGGVVFFPASGTSFDRELWKSDGTSAGTVLVKDILPGPIGSSPKVLTDVNGTLFFSANVGGTGEELYKSNGTSAGTVLVKDIVPGSDDSRPVWLTNVNGTLFFSTFATSAANGNELWKSNGTTAGTIMVKDIVPGSGSSNPGNFVNFNGTLFFSANDGANGTELWKSDGTSAGTVLFKDINPGSGSSNPTSLVNVNGTLFFKATDGTNGVELWKSDGTGAGTVIVKDISPGSASSNPDELTGASGTLFFTANDGTNGVELWKSDGSFGGTMLVKDIFPGSSGSTPDALTNVNGLLVFAADDGTHGAELWKSNGIPGGTVMVADIRTGPSGALLPPIITAGCPTVFFLADDGTTGGELWGVPWSTLAITGPQAAALCPGQNATMTVAVAGSGLVTYEWHKDGAALADGVSAGGSIVSGATASALTVAGIAAFDAGMYQCVIHGVCKADTTAPVPLTVQCDAPTPSGNNVTVSLGPDVTLTFDRVTESGNSSVSSTIAGPNPPDGATFIPSGATNYFNLSTTVMFSGQVTICLAYDPAQVSGNPGDIKVIHWDTSLQTPAWRDITTSVDQMNHVVCGKTDHLSPFALMEHVSITGVDTPMARTMRLVPPIPNPFQGATEITFELALGGPVRVRVLDVHGRVVRTLLDEAAAAAGVHRAIWNGRGSNGEHLVAGVYFVEMRTQFGSRTRKIVLNR